MPVSEPARKSFEEVRTAFATRSILSASPRELEELLAAVAAEPINDPAIRAQAREMGETMRQLHAAKSGKRPSRLAVAAAVIAVAALISSGAQLYREWNLTRFGARAFMASSTEGAFAASHTPPADLRTQSTIAELARRAPSLRTGTVQAWWAGEQARQVEKLEAQAKRQALAGDREGAARSASRADAIRSRIPALAEFERPATRE